MGTAVATAQVKLTLVDRVTAGVKRIQAVFARLSARLGLDRISRAFRGIGVALKGVYEGFGKATARLGKFTAMLGLGGGGAIAAAVAMVRQTTALGVELDALSRRAGVSAEALQELKYAASTRGVGFDALVDGLKELNLRADEFIANGTGSGAEAFKKLGYSASDLKKKLEDPAALFGEIMERVSKLDRATQIRFTDELFGGTAGEQFMQMMGMSAADMAALRVEARKLGNVLGDDVVAASRELNNQWAALIARIDGIKLRIGAGLIPVFQEAVGQITDWVDANRDLIRTKINEWVQALTRFIRDLLNPASELRQRIAGIVKGFTDFYEFIRPVVDYIGGPMIASFVALGLYIGAPLISALSLLSLAFLKLGGVILATPFGWILGGLVLLGLAVYTLIEHWEEFAAYWRGVWTRITDAFDQGFIQGVLTLLHEFNPVTHIIRAVDAVIEFLTGVSLIDEGKALLRSLADGILEGVNAAIKALGDLFDDLVAFVSERASQWVEVGKSIVNWMLDGVKAGWDQLVDWIMTSFRDLWNNTFAYIPGFSEWEAPKAVAAATVNPEAMAELRGAASLALQPLPGPMPAPDGPSSGGDVEAGVITTQSLLIPEPLVVREPQSIDASITIQSLVIEGGAGTPAEISAAVRSALAAHSAEQRAAVQSGLTD